MTKQTITTRHRVDYDCHTLDDMIEKLVQLKTEIGGHSKFCVEASDSYGSPYCETYFEVEREETDTEYSVRVEKENKRSVAQQMFRRGEYEKLKKEFENA